MQTILPPSTIPELRLGKWVRSLFLNNEPGVWYDPSDLSTLFQDAAGTTPVTAVEQPVGRILDKSGRGFHATQTTTTSRPVLSARVNLLTKTEDFSDAVWTKTFNGTGSIPVVTPNAGTAPDGTNTANRIVFNKGSGDTTADFSLIGQIGINAGSTCKGSVYVKSYTGSTQKIMIYVVQSASAQVSTLSVGSEWVQISATTSFSITSGGIYIGTRGGAAFGGDNTLDLLVWGADLRVANTGAGLPAYQRVNTATDYDTSGFPHYLRFDGADDWLVTPTITPGTDKAQVFAGVRKLSDAARGIVAELGTTGLEEGVCNLSAPVSATPSYGFRGLGSPNQVGNVGKADVTSGYSAPITNVLTGLGDILGDSAILRINGAQAAADITTNQGTGNYLAYPLYIGRRGGTTLPFNGHLYSLIVRFGANLPAGTIASTESWVNWKTGALDWREVTDAASFRWNSATASPDAE